MPPLQLQLQSADVSLQSSSSNSFSQRSININQNTLLPSSSSNSFNQHSINLNQNTLQSSDLQNELLIEENHQTLSTISTSFSVQNIRLLFENINTYNSGNSIIEDEDYSINATKTLHISKLTNHISMVALQSMCWFLNKNATFYPTLAKLILGSSLANITLDITNKINLITQSIDCSNNTFNCFQQTCLASNKTNEIILSNEKLLVTLIRDIYHKDLTILHWNATGFNLQNYDPKTFTQQNAIIMYYDTDLNFFGPILTK